MFYLTVYPLFLFLVPTFCERHCYTKTFLNVCHKRCKQTCKSLLCRHMEYGCQLFSFFRLLFLEIDRFSKILPHNPASSCFQQSSFLGIWNISFSHTLYDELF